MTMTTKKDIFKAHLAEWLKAKGDRKKRGKMVKEISQIAQVHQKSVSRSFKRVQMRDPYTGENRGRLVYYTNDCLAALYDAWDAASRPCGELLHPLIEDYIQGYLRESRWKHSDVATKKLREMSLITIKRSTKALRRKHGNNHGKSTTKASALKKIIPIFKGPWDTLEPGNAQLDTVAHCGDSVAGDFAYTVSFVDAPTYWGVRRAQWNKGQTATKDNLIVIKKRLPFPWIMAHPDTGSEFINWITKQWCDDNDIHLTRSEPGKKNDNMLVEERNGHVVRKYLGWQRLDANPDIVPLINTYYDVLDKYLNHFQAVRRTLTKEKVGSKYLRTFEKAAKTPYQRLMEHESVAKSSKERIRKEHDSLNPLLLKEQLDILSKNIFNFQKTAGLGNHS
jgi:hypothetical protein